MNAGYEVTIIFVDDQRYNAAISDSDIAWERYLTSMNGILSVRTWLVSRTWRFLPKKVNQLLQIVELLFKMTLLCLRHRGSVYHCHDLGPAFFCIFAARVWGAKLVYDAHEFETQQGNPGIVQKRILVAYEKWIVRTSRLVITVNSEIATQMRKMHGRLVRVIENRPKMVSPVRCQSRQEVKIYYVGYLGPGRGVLETVRALQFLPLAYRFYVLGTGRIDYTRDSAYGLAHELGISSDRIRFVAPVPPDEVIPHLGCADVSVVLLSKGESNNANPSPNKFYQSVMARVPVVASDIPELKQLVENSPYGRLGYCVDETDSRAVADAIKQAAEMKKNVNAMIAFERAAKELSWESEAEKLLQYYSRDVIGNADRR